MTALLRILRTSAALFASAALVVSSAVPAAAQTLGTNGKPITNRAGATFGVLSHRGGMAQWPENSVEAYTNSVAAGFDAIETDVVFTSDGHGVMSHYDLLPDRCSPAGIPIHTMTLAQVRQVRCLDLDDQFTVPIPTFEQLAAILSGNTGVRLTLDIKTYDGQSAGGRRAWAKQAVQLVKSHGLLDRTALLTFSWDQALPVIRTYAPKAYVLALDHGTMDLDRVSLAARLGASGFGIKMKYTSAFLAGYVKKKGMDSVPWEVIGTEQRAFTIFYGGKLQLFSSDTPTLTRQELVGGIIDINPVPKPSTTRLAAPKTISKATYKANRRRYPKVGTSIVPSGAIPMLRDVRLSIRVKGGKGKGYLRVGASSSPLSSSVKVRLPKGTRTLTVQAPLGDGRKLRIYTTRTVKLTVRVIDYTRIRFA